MIAPKPKAFPIVPSAPWLATVMQSCVCILAINWLCQGMRGMDGKELSFRLLLELAVWLLVFAGLAAAGAGGATAAMIGLPAAHSFGFLANGQLWVCVRYCRFYDRDPRALDRFLDRATVTLRRCPWLEEAMCIGSQGAGAPTRRSDIDLRLIFPRGAAAWVRTNLLLLRLRAWALFARIPLDLYAYSSLGSLKRFRQSEPLLVLVDRRNRIRDGLAHRTLVVRP